MKRFMAVAWVLIFLFAGCGNEAVQEASVEPSIETTVSEKETVKEPETEPPEATVSEVLLSEETKQEEQIEKEEEKEMSATLLYQGHASVRIVTGEGKVIYIDPFMGEGYDLPADLILMTHGHYDHTQDKLIKDRNEDCTKITWAEAIKNGKYQVFDLGYVTVEPVEAGYNKNHNAKECVGFVLTFADGVKVYFSGDTSTTPHMADLADKELDYAFICCDGVYNMDVAEASECAKLIKAKHTIPYHMIPAKGNGFDQGVADSFEAEGKLIVKPGEELVLSK